MYKELLRAIELSDTPFKLRQILNQHGTNLKHEELIKAFLKRIGQLTKLYERFKPDQFMVECLQNLTFDFEAEIIEGVHTTPPAVPLPIEETKTQKPGPDEFKYKPRARVHWNDDIHDNLLKEVEYALILKALESMNHNRTKTAKLLGISKKTMRNKLRNYEGLGMIERGYDIARHHNDAYKKDVTVAHQGVSEWIEEEQTRPKSLEEWKKWDDEHDKKNRDKLIETNAGKLRKATCCEGKLEWREGLCLLCYKREKDRKLKEEGKLT